MITGGGREEGSRTRRGTWPATKYSVVSQDIGSGEGGGGGEEEELGEEGQCPL
jgi:hypothetical protein